ncbi:MAG: hypothetical protein WC479_08235 [Candidatus Izemoplasmatales bacterium]
MKDISKEIGEEVAREIQEATLLGDEFYGFLPIQKEYPVLNLFIENALSKIALLTKDPTEAVRLICMMVVTVLARANKEERKIVHFYLTGRLGYTTCGKPLTKVTSTWKREDVTCKSCRRRF